MTVSTPGRVGGTFLTGLVPFIRQTSSIIGRWTGEDAC